MVRAYFAAIPVTGMGLVNVWLVDKEGYQLHTEPVCTVSSEYHQWFVDWLKEQECPEMFSSVRHEK